MSSAHPSGIVRVVRWLLVATAICVTLLGGSLSAALAAEPTLTAAPVLIDPLDPRTGDEPSAVGAPLLALLLVIGSGALVFVVTYAFVRVSRGRTTAG